MIVRYLARIRFRRRKAREVRASTHVQALARGMFARAATDRLLVAKVAAEKDQTKQARWLLARLVVRFLARLRAKKATAARAGAAVAIQARFRGMRARGQDTRLRRQDKLVRDWLGDLKQQRVGQLTDSKQVTRCALPPERFLF